MTPEPYPTPWRWVDLGLPSGTLWLDRNVGAESPEDIGLYFQWGQKFGHPFGDGFEFNSESYSQQELNLITEDLTIVNDAAACYYGNKYRMPSSGEFEELIGNTTISKETNGVRLTSIINGESILLPLSGDIDGQTIEFPELARVWTRTYYDRSRAYAVSGGDTIRVSYTNNRYRGMPVRPVYNR